MRVDAAHSCAHPRSGNSRFLRVSVSFYLMIERASGISWLQCVIGSSYLSRELHWICVILFDSVRPQPTSGRSVFRTYGAALLRARATQLVRLLHGVDGRREKIDGGSETREGVQGRSSWSCEERKKKKSASSARVPREVVVLWQDRGMETRGMDGTFGSHWVGIHTFG